MAFTSGDISSTMLFFEIPFMYAFYISNERFSIGPKLKYLYLTDRTYAGNDGKVVSLGRKSNGAGGVRLMYEREF